MAEVVRREVPPGTPVEGAGRFMRREGFTCSECVKDSFMDRVEIDFLYCSRSDGVGYVKRKWMVAIVHQQGAVTEVLVRTGIEGL
jgi:hypothetical protein